MACGLCLISLRCLCLVVSCVLGYLRSDFGRVWSCLVSPYTSGVCLDADFTHQLEFECCWSFIWMILMLSMSVKAHFLNLLLSDCHGLLLLLGFNATTFIFLICYFCWWLSQFSVNGFSELLFTATYWIIWDNLLILLLITYWISSTSGFSLLMHVDSWSCCWLSYVVFPGLSYLSASGFPKLLQMPSATCCICLLPFTVWIAIFSKLFTTWIAFWMML